MRRIRSRLAEYHSADRLRAQGVDVFFGVAHFAASDALLVGDTRLRFKKALVATGSQPQRSTIPGLEEAGYLTSDSVFELASLPRRLAIIGGGPLGCEAAQTFSRLGAHVTLVQDEPKFLPHEERDASQLLSYSLARDGVDTRLNTVIQGVRVEAGVKILDTLNDATRYRIDADEILLSIGRTPNVADLGLAAAGIAFDPATGIVVDDFLRTTNPRVYAAGDVCLSLRFTNAAEATARMAVQNAFAAKRRRLSLMTIPWCTYCDPEIAHVGMHVWDASERSVPIKSFTVMMQDVARAITDGQDDGFVKIHVKLGTDRILRRHHRGVAGERDDQRDLRRHEHRHRHAQARQDSAYLSGAIRRDPAGGARLHARPAGVLAAADVRPLVRVKPHCASALSTMACASPSRVFRWSRPRKLSA